MNDAGALALVGVLFPAVFVGAACGGAPLESAASPDAGAAASADQGSADSPTGEACAPPPPIKLASPGGPPEDVGCYEQRDGTWLRIPCNCELLLDNTTPAEVGVQITLAVSPADVRPMLAGSPVIELTFPDPDSTWYDVWTTNPGNETALAITHLDGSTTVRLGAGSVTLAPVPLGACQTRVGTATVGDMPGTTLDMQAVLRRNDGQSATILGSCVSLPRP